MNSTFWENFTRRFLFVFIVGFILSLPQNYYFFPDFGEMMRPITEPIGQLFTSENDKVLFSDSPVMLGWIFGLFYISIIIALLWSFLKRTSHPNLQFWLYALVTYYLAFVLFFYGFNKIFKYQFFFPEPNTLYTPLGQLSPDILYWSSMGTSYSYSIFAGLMEVIPACLSLFRKTRLLGGLIALAVLTNVAMINFGFDITVKIFSLFLILLSLIVIHPHRGRLYDFFIGNNLAKPPEKMREPGHKFYAKAYPFIKPLVIGLILFEALIPYFESGYFNGDNMEKSAYYGAYEVVSPNQEDIKRVFVHSRGYFITQSESDVFTDYRLEENGDILKLKGSDGLLQLLFISPLIEPNEFRLAGKFNGINIDWTILKLELEQLPVHTGNF